MKCCSQLYKQRAAMVVMPQTCSLLQKGMPHKPAQAWPEHYTPHWHPAYKQEAGEYR